jgi:hypothetical protein
LRANDVTIQAEKGAHVRGASTQGKAALVIRGNNTTIIGLECSQVKVPDGNGACIRMEGENLTLRNVHFHGNQMGILSGPKSGRVVIEDSVIENNGIAGGALGHNLYINGDALEVRRSRILSARNEGHEIKSRAAKTLIEDCVIASLDAVDSRLIDTPNGGEVILRNNLLEEGPASSNMDIIGFGLERKNPKAKFNHDINTIVIENNTVLVDRRRGALFLRQADATSITITGNTVIGGEPLDDPGNKWFRTRAEAGFPPYPAIAK